MVKKIGAYAPFFLSFFYFFKFFLKYFTEVEKKILRFLLKNVNYIKKFRILAM
mgnify:CR=1 FL=1